MLQAAPSASKTVYVSGLAASATEKKLLDFFTFCGKIEAVQMVSFVFILLPAF
jgi:RNA recognition motif-containing protein